VSESGSTNLHSNEFRSQAPAIALPLVGLRRSSISSPIDSSDTIIAGG
jgi:hypothetical protein